MVLFVFAGWLHQLLIGIDNMRVTIGPYPRWNRKAKTYTPKKREIKIRLHNYDVWNFDHTLSLIILPGLKILRKSKCGAPFVDDVDVPENIRAINAPKLKKNENTDKFWFKRWDYILDEMIWVFTEISNNRDYIPICNDKTLVEAYNKHVATALGLFGKYFSCLWT